MSLLQNATFAYPPGSIMTRQMAKDARLLTLSLQHEQCRKAFLQNPTPRLGNCLKQIEASLRYERRSK